MGAQHTMATRDGVQAKGKTKGSMDPVQPCLVYFIDGTDLQVEPTKGCSKDSARKSIMAGHRIHT